MNLIFSRRLAITIGITLPLAETLRLWGGGSVALGMDHYIMGVILLYGVWRSRGYDILGQRYLIAAWAFTCGVGYMNLIRHLERVHSTSPAPSQDVWIVGMTGFGWLICILGLAASFKTQLYGTADKNRSVAQR